MNRLVMIGGLVLLPAALLADFSYTETTRMTGGMLVQMSRSLGGISKSMRQITEPHANSVYIKGDRMANIGDQSGQIWDLSKETITQIDFEKKTYSVITLAEMKAAMEKAMERANSQVKDQKERKGSDATDVDVKMDVKDTGNKKNIAGFDAHEVLMTITTEMKDKKSGETAATQMMSSIWLVESIPGHQELQAFYKKMAEKMASTWAANPMARQAGMMAASNPKMMEWAQKMAKEGEKMKGVHVMQVMKYGSGLDPAKAGEVTDPSTMPQGPTAGDVAKTQARDQALGGIVRGLPGGFGGLGRRRSKEKEQPAEAQPQQGQAAPSGVLMEMVMQGSNYSTASVDASKFDVPAGFQKVESPMLKMAR